MQPRENSIWLGFGLEDLVWGGAQVVQESTQLAERTFTDV